MVQIAPSFACTATFNRSQTDEPPSTRSLVCAFSPSKAGRIRSPSGTWERLFCTQMAPSEPRHQLILGNPCTTYTVYTSTLNEVAPRSGVFLFRSLFLAFFLRRSARRLDPAWFTCCCTQSDCWRRYPSHFLLSTYYLYPSATASHVFSHLKA